VPPEDKPEGSVTSSAPYDPELPRDRDNSGGIGRPRSGKYAPHFASLLARPSLSWRSVPAAIPGEHVKQRPKVGLRPVFRRETC
jgi:hypothetical protein